MLQLDEKLGHRLNGFMINAISVDTEPIRTRSDGYLCASQTNYDKEMHAKFPFL